MALRRPQTMAEEWRKLVDVDDGGSGKSSAIPAFLLSSFAAAFRIDAAEVQ